MSFHVIAGLEAYELLMGINDADDMTEEEHAETLAQQGQREEAEESCMMSQVGREKEEEECESVSVHA